MNTRKRQKFTFFISTILGLIFSIQACFGQAAEIPSIESCDKISPQSIFIYLSSLKNSKPEESKVLTIEKAFTLFHSCQMINQRLREVERINFKFIELLRRDEKINEKYADDLLFFFDTLRQDQNNKEVFYLNVKINNNNRVIIFYNPSTPPLEILAEYSADITGKDKEYFDRGFWIAKEILSTERIEEEWKRELNGFLAENKVSEHINEKLIDNWERIKDILNGNVPVPRDIEILPMRIAALIYQPFRPTVTTHSAEPLPPVAINRYQ